MDLFRAVVVLGTIVTVSSTHHSLTYIYTALSKSVNLPGIHEFTAMGLLDGKMIDYYDSVEQKKVPKQPWMKERMAPDYWEKGTTSRKSKEQWFKVNVNILMERMSQNNSDLHVLQWSHGCEIKQQPDGPSVFIKGTDHYSYDGEDFLSFDDANMRWIAPVPAAVPTKTKWDTVQMLNQYTKGYLEKECVDWLEKFVVYEKNLNIQAKPPVIFAFAKKARNPGNIQLTCMGTGFYPKDVILEIRKDNMLLDELDGVQSTGVRPNGDGTYQIRKTVEIREDDKGEYDCFGDHIGLATPIVKRWDKKCTDCTKGMVSAAVIAVFVVLFIVGVVLLGLYLKRYKPSCLSGYQLSPYTIPLPVPGQMNGTDPLNKLPAAEDKDSARGSSDNSDKGSPSNSMPLLV